MKNGRRCAGLLVLVFLLTTFSLGADAKMLIPGGHTIGLKAYSQGLIVTGVEENSPAKKAGLQQGDILRSVQGVPLKTAGQLTDRMTDGKLLHLEIDRGKSSYAVSVQPVRTENTYRLGAYVRDNVAGIGTVSYYDPQDGSFGALGHGINDLGGNALLPISGGVVIPSQVGSVVKGISGTAGQLKGQFETNKIIGEVHRNTENGVFGALEIPREPAIPVATSDEVKVGKAEIRSNVQGDKVESYDIEIVKCFENDKSHGRNMLVRICDPELLEVTGGIVQGMSGSPIIQNGKLVGAVTHVLVNEPELGYGIFIENMLDAAG